MGENEPDSCVGSAAPSGPDVRLDDLRRLPNFDSGCSALGDLLPSSSESTGGGRNPSRLSACFGGTCAVSMGENEPDSCEATFGPSLEAEVLERRELARLARRDSATPLMLEESVCRLSPDSDRLPCLP